jgi:hypothetical protein
MEIKDYIDKLAQQEEDLTTELQQLQEKIQLLKELTAEAEELENDNPDRIGLRGFHDKTPLSKKIITLLRSHCNDDALGVRDIANLLSQTDSDININSVRSMVSRLARTKPDLIVKVGWGKYKYKMPTPKKVVMEEFTD